MKQVIMLFACLLVFTATARIQADQAGSSISDDFKLNGSTKVVDQSIRLTNEVWQAGSAFWKEPCDITAFDTSFTFYLHSEVPKGTADGFTFCIQNDPKGASALGTAGGSLGYGTPGKSPMIARSVAVEFDNYCNTDDGFPDFNYDHTGININGNMVSVKTTRLPMPLTGDPLQTRIRYDGQWLDVFVWKGTEQPAEPLLHERIDIPSVVGKTTAYVGFTGGTGRWFMSQDISRWKF